MHRFNVLPSILLFFVFSLNVFADGLPDGMKEKLDTRMGEGNIKSITETIKSDIWAVITNGGQIFYTDNDVKILLTGEFLIVNDDNSITNHTKSLRSGINKDLIASIDEKDFVTFEAKDKEKESIAYVFTDTTCGYCRKFHKEMDILNSLNVTVKYLAFPRGGMGNVDHLQNIWCAENREETMTMAKNGQDIGVAPKCESNIEQQYMAAQQIGVKGTPTIIFENGTVRGGYIPPKELAYQASLNKI
jgi:thiol:disulfide interchange protein DsbC